MGVRVQDELLVLGCRAYRIEDLGHRAFRIEGAVEVRVAYLPLRCLQFRSWGLV